MWATLVPHGQSLSERLIEEIQGVSRGLASKGMSSQQTLGDFKESSPPLYNLSAFREAETLSLLQKKFHFLLIPLQKEAHSLICSASRTTSW